VKMRSMRADYASHRTTLLERNPSRLGSFFFGFRRGDKGGVVWGSGNSAVLGTTKKKPPPLVVWKKCRRKDFQVTLEEKDQQQKLEREMWHLTVVRRYCSQKSSQPRGGEGGGVFKER